MSASPLTVEGVCNWPSSDTISSTQSTRWNSPEISSFLKSRANESVLTETFSLPQSFPPHVEGALAEKSMNSRALAAFITTIGRAVFAVKRYPSASEYDTVSRLVIERYPFLKSPLGRGYVRFICTCK